MKVEPSLETRYVSSSGTYKLVVVDDDDDDVLAVSYLRQKTAGSHIQSKVFAFLINIDIIQM